MFGACKSCSEKDLRIGDLKAEIAYLRELVRPEPLNHKLPLIDLERDAIMSASDEMIDVKTDPTDEDDYIQREASALLSGTY